MTCEENFCKITASIFKVGRLAKYIQNDKESIKLKISVSRRKGEENSAKIELYLRFEIREKSNDFFGLKLGQSHFFELHDCKANKRMMATAKNFILFMAIPVFKS
jgi:preprotein translocase subunit SecB